MLPERASKGKSPPNLHFCGIFRRGALRAPHHKSRPLGAGTRSASDAETHPNERNISESRHSRDLRAPCRYIGPGNRHDIAALDS
jgi:hypothetical protein